jgi:sporulation protein YqfC
MFNFLNDINDLLQVPITNTFSDYKYVNLSGKVIYVQGYKDVLTFSQTNIILKLKSGELNITGENLNIKDLNLNSIVIEGVIKIVEQVGGN